LQIAAVVVLPMKNAGIEMMIGDTLSARGGLLL
jgi:hypothetical protein